MDISPTGLKGAITTGVARWAGALAGGAAFGFLLSHTQVTAWLNQACTSLNSEDALKEFFGAAAVAAVPLVLSIKDKFNVNGKMAAAAAAGFDKGQAQVIQQAQEQGANVQTIGNGIKAAAVADALKQADTATKAEKAAVVGALKSGTF